MDNYVLRKSYGPYSAGTQVDEVLDNEVHYFALGSETIPHDLVVKRRNMTINRPNTTSSRERHKARREAKKNG